MIYLKEDSRLYLEDSTVYLMNITNVTIASYSDDSDVPDRATIVPTEIPQSTPGKTVLHILNDFDLKLDEVIAEGNYTESELSQLNFAQVTFQILRSNVYIDNVNIEREPVDLEKATLLVNLIYLQDKVMSMTNIDMNVTGIILKSGDPFNGLFENITIDSYGLIEGFDIILNCNYPEASLQNEVIFNYIKATTSGNRQVSLNPQIVNYQGPGNATVSNSDYVDFFTLVQNLKATNVFYKDGFCQPDDDLLQTFTFDNTTLSLINEDLVEGRETANVMILSTNLYRKFEGYVKNDHYVNFQNPAFISLYLEGEANTKMFITNSEFVNYTAGPLIPVWILKCKSVHVENIMVENVTNLDTPMFYFEINKEKIFSKFYHFTQIKVH